MTFSTASTTDEAYNHLTIWERHPLLVLLWVETQQVGMFIPSEPEGICHYRNSHATELAARYTSLLIPFYTFTLVP